MREKKYPFLTCSQAVHVKCTHAPAYTSLSLPLLLVFPGIFYANSLRKGRKTVSERETTFHSSHSDWSTSRTLFLCGKHEVHRTETTASAPENKSHKGKAHLRRVLAHKSCCSYGGETTVSSL